MIKQPLSRWWKVELLILLGFNWPSWGSMSAIKIDRWHRKWGKRKRVLAAKTVLTGSLKTAAFPLGVLVSWEANKVWGGGVRQTHMLLSVSLITAGIHAEGQECKMSLHFKCCDILDCSEVALHWKTTLFYLEISCQ